MEHILREIWEYFRAKIGIRNLIWICVILCVLICAIIVIFFVPLPEKTLANNWNWVKFRNQDQSPKSGISSFSKNIVSKAMEFVEGSDINPASPDPDYIYVFSDTLKITDSEAQDFPHLRREIIDLLFDSADNKFRRKGATSYAGAVKNLLINAGNGGSGIVDFLASHSILELHEGLDTDYGKYWVNAKMAKNAAKEVNYVIDFVTETACMDSALETFVTVLSTNSSVTFDFQQILIKLRFYCGSSPGLKYILDICGDNTYDCSGLYFSSGEYQLSLVSEKILQCLSDMLSRQNTGKKILVEFHGFTDTEPVGPRGIPYSGNAEVAPLNTLLPADNRQTDKLTKISSNLELSFARAYSCYEYFKSKMQVNNIELRYTGEGDSQQIENNNNSRTVQITIRFI